MSGSRRAAALLLLGAALVLVAVAARGRPEVASDSGRRPSEWVLDVVVSLVLVQLVVGAALLAVLFVLRPQELVQTTARAPGRRARAATVLVGLLVLLLVIVAVRRVVGSEGDGLLPGLGGAGGADDTLRDAGNRYEPRFATVPVLVVAGLLAVAVTAWLLAARRSRAAAGPQEALQAALLAALDEGIDDLEAEPDPRQAVIAAYARLERVLAAHGVPRRAAEAPDEYLGRVLASVDVGRAAVTRLTALYQAAKFSDHAVGTATKSEAIEAFVRARDELHAARELAEAERLAAVERAGRGSAA
jgi:hypothetical protein